MYFAKVLTISTLFAVLVACGNGDPAARLVGGQDVDTLRQFPFYVYITLNPSGRKCGGSILNAQWILTSAQCVKNTVRVELSFGKKNEEDSKAGFFTVSVNNDQIYVYPTNYDDLALIKIPMRLIFSDTISPVVLSRLSIDGLRNKFAVMPGFNEVPMPTTNPDNGPPTPSITTPTPTTTKTTTSITTTTTPKPTTTTKAPTNNIIDDNLKYGMFNVLEQSVCRRDLGAGKFDEYNQICTEGWGSNPNTPCDSDFGSALIIGWPAKSELIGIFSKFSPTCNTNVPAVYTYVAKYLTWIDSMILG